MAQTVGHLTQKPEVPGLIPGPATYFRLTPSTDSRRAVVSYWRKYVHKVLVNHLGGLNLPRKSNKTEGVFNSFAVHHKSYNFFIPHHMTVEGYPSPCPDIGLHLVSSH